MKKSGFRLLSIALLACLFSLSVHLCSAASQKQHNFLWKVQSKTNTVYLLGSVHFMKKDVYPLNTEIEEAFRVSDVLAVEADVNDVIGIDMPKIMSAAFYPEGDSLEGHISGETLERIKKEFELLGMPSWLVIRQKPWFLALSLTSLKLVQSGLDPAYGIDVHFLSKAQGQKKIRELESIDYQIDLLSGFSDSEQEAFLRYTLNDLNSLEKNIDILITAWKNGDVRAMESVIVQGVKDDSATASIYEKLIYGRNRNMTQKIEDFLKTNETYFVIIGAGHLVGEKGIVGILKQRGYQVQQL
jgi:uncharacterized protein